ncbi:MAG: winged helix-turn-helix domain-containing protein [Candidatus Micrarchaeota archaeon]
MVGVEEYFGAKSGIVWSCLNEFGPLTIAQLKRKTKLTDSEVYAGLGWLGREGKLDIVGEVPLLYKYKLRQ